MIPKRYTDVFFDFIMAMNAYHTKHETGNYHAVSEKIQPDGIFSTRIEFESRLIDMFKNRVINKFSPDQKELAIGVLENAVDVSCSPYFLDDESDAVLAFIFDLPGVIKE